MLQLRSQTRASGERSPTRCNDSTSRKVTPLRPARRRFPAAWRVSWAPSPRLHGGQVGSPQTLRGAETPEQSSLLWLRSGFLPVSFSWKRLALGAEGAPAAPLASCGPCVGHVRATPRLLSLPREGGAQLVCMSPLGAPAIEPQLRLPHPRQSPGPTSCLIKTGVHSVGLFSREILSSKGSPRQPELTPRTARSSPASRVHCDARPRAAHSTQKPSMQGSGRGQGGVPAIVWERGFGLFAYRGVP